MKSEHDKQIAELMDKIKAAELKKYPPLLDAKKPEAVNVDASGDEDNGSNIKNTEDIVTIDSNDDYNMSDLSIDSSVGDTEPIMNSINRKRRERIEKNERKCTSYLD